MINELISAFFFIFIAEMGDKTQVLAMAFATQYSTSKVLLGVFIGALLNHGLAIILGVYLSSAIPLDYIQIVAGFAFIGFGFWALKSDNDEEDDESKNKFGPILTVAVAFFIGELGDKTQLTAMTLATDSVYPVFILCGTVLGMIATSGIGIFVGRKVGEKIPELAIKIISSGVFIFFGTLKLFQTVPHQYITTLNTTLFFLFLTGSVLLMARPIIKARKVQQRTALQEVAATLYIQAHEMKKAVNNICLGEEHCGECEGRQCLVGFARKALELAENKEYTLSPDWRELPKLNNDKAFNQDKIIEALSILLEHIISVGNIDDTNYVVNKARQALETIVFGEIIPFNKDIKEYYQAINRKDKRLAKKIKSKVNEKIKSKKEKRE